MNDSIREDEGKDHAPYFDSALEHVVEIICNFGQYPQPERKHGIEWMKPMPLKPMSLRKFDLYEELMDGKFIGREDLLEYFILSMNDYSRSGSFEGQRSSWEKRLVKFLKESDDVNSIALEVAQEYAEEDRG
jgi:hypothetical protein